MLTDPLYLRGIESGGLPVNAAVPTFSTGLATLRTVSVTGTSVVREGLIGSSGRFRLSISHSKSNENLPFTTDRHLVRLDYSDVDEIQQKPYTASAYAVITVPHNNNWANASSVDLMRRLGFFLLHGDVSSAGAVVLANADTSARFIAGEG